MINYIYNELYNLQGWFVMVSDCEEISLARGVIERPSHGFELDSQTHY